MQGAVSVLVGALAVADLLYVNLVVGPQVFSGTMRSQPAEAEHVESTGIAPDDDSMSDAAPSGRDLSSRASAREASSNGSPEKGTPRSPGVGEAIDGAWVVHYGQVGQVKLGPEAKQLLATVAEQTIANADKILTVVGHTDARGAADDNWRLGEVRAQIVVRELVNLGVPVRQVRAKSGGEYQLIARGGTDEDHSRNRRTEFFLDDHETSAAHSLLESSKRQAQGLQP